MNAKDCHVLVLSKIKELQKLRIQKQIEINCLSEEINRLEDLGFVIEKELEKEMK